MPQTITPPVPERVGRLSLYDQLSHDADRLMDRLKLAEPLRPTARSFYLTVVLIAREQDNTDGSTLHKAIDRLREDTKLVIKIEKIGDTFKLLVRQQKKGASWVNVTEMVDHNLVMVLAANLHEKRNRKSHSDDFLLLDRSHREKRGVGRSTLGAWITRATN